MAEKIMRPYGDTFVVVKDDRKRLSFTGVEGPRSGGNARGGCGQILDSMRDKVIQHGAVLDFGPGWTTALLLKFLDTWDRWHLNDMRAGSPAQEQWLRENPLPKESYAYPKSYFDVAGEALKNAGLNPDPANGYKYGHAWNFEQVPTEVIEFLNSLPETDIQPAWC